MPPAYLKQDEKGKGAGKKKLTQPAADCRGRALITNDSAAGALREAGRNSMREALKKVADMHLIGLIISG